MRQYTTYIQDNMTDIVIYFNKNKDLVEINKVKYPVQFDIQKDPNGTETVEIAFRGVIDPSELHNEEVLDFYVDVALTHLCARGAKKIDLYSLTFRQVKDFKSTTLDANTFKPVFNREQVEAALRHYNQAGKTLAARLCEKALEEGKLEEPLPPFDMTKMLVRISVADLEEQDESEEAA